MLLYLYIQYTYEKQLWLSDNNPKLPFGYVDQIQKYRGGLANFKLKKLSDLFAAKKKKQFFGKVAAYSTKIIRKSLLDT